MQESDLRYEGWRVVLACGVGTFCASAPYYVFAVFLKPISDEFAWSRESAAAGYSAMAVVAAVAAAPMGRLLDRVGAWRIVWPCLTISGLAVSSLSLLTSSLLHLYIVSGVIGLATIGASPVAYSRAIFSWFDAHRGRALGLMLGGAAMAAILLPPWAATLLQRFGWRVSWLAFGLMTLIIGVPVVAAWLRERVTPPPSSSVAQLTGVVLVDALRTRRFWTLTLVICGAGIVTSGTLVHLSALLTDRGFSAGGAAGVISVMGVANLAGRLLTGWLLDRYHAPAVSAALLTIAALGVLLLSIVHSVPLALVAALLIGIGTGGEVDVNPYLLSRYFGMRSLSTLYGFNWMAWGLASAAGPVLMGRAFDSTGSYAVVLVRLAVVTLFAAVLMLTLPAPARHGAGGAGMA